jgi:hypothetical protein
MTIDAVLTDVRRAFGSLSEPHFGVVGQRVLAGPDEALVTTLADRFEVADTSDANEDYGWHLHLAANGRDWALAVSAVGPYAAFARIGAAWEDILTVDRRDLTPEERWVTDLLTERRVTLLSQAELEEPVPLALDGNDDVRVFNALFQEGGILPWDQDTLRRFGLI